MINASQLRIGNCVYDASGFVRFISHRKLSDIASNPTGHGYKSISLSPEWLKKFGFITLDAETDIVIWGLDDNSNGEEFSIVSDGLDTPIPLYFSYDLGYREIRKEIQSVHQLQNLYFALTGEELKVNL